MSPRVGHAKLPARGSIATAALVVALVAGFVSIGSPASADPNNAALSAQATSLAAEVNRLELRAEIVTERYNGVSARLAGIVTETLTASERLDALNGTNTTVHDQATRRVAAIYKAGGGLSLYATVLDGSSPADMIDRLHTVQSLVGNDYAQVAGSARAVADASATKDRLLSLAHERTDLERQAQGARDEVRSLLAKQRAALATANATILRLVAEEQQRQQAAAEAAAATALAGASAIIGNAAPGNPFAVAAIAAAQGKLGVPYVWGATGPNTFDCSGLVQWAYRQAGLSVMRIASDQYRSGPEVALSALAPGDLVFWASDPANKSTIHHVAIYVGNAKMIEAPHTGAFVRLVPLRLGSEFAGAVRPGLGATTAGNA